MKNSLKKYITLFVLLCISLLTNAADYTNNSVLSSGKWIKIGVQNTGIYKITYAELEKYGLNPAQLHIYGYGGNVLSEKFSEMTYDDLPEVSIYDSGSYILFYAKGVVKWKYQDNRFVHINNTYSTQGYYFLTSNSNPRKLISEKIENEVPNTYSMSFTDYQLHEQELYNFVKSGKEFFGETFSNNSQQTFSFNLSGYLVENAIVDLEVASNSTLGTNFEVSIAGTKQSNLNIPGMTGNYQKASVISSQYSFVPSSVKNDIQLGYKGTQSTNGYLNYIRVNYRRRIECVSPFLAFRDPNSVGDGNVTRFTVAAANNKWQIWDVSDAENVVSMSTELSGSVFYFTAKTDKLREFVALDLTANFPSVNFIGSVSNQNLHGLPQTDMVIITHKDFKQYADSFANFHKKYDGMTVAVVYPETIYNEFSSGTPDATAYRRLMKMLYDKYSVNPPKYLMLMGRGSYDNRNILLSSGNNNYLLTYQFGSSSIETSSYVCDDYFAFLQDDSGENLFADKPCIGVGRLPITSNAQAKNIYNKIKNYVLSDDKGNWKSKMIFVADDKDNSLHMNQANKLADKVRNKYKEYSVEKLFCDAYQRVVESNQATYPEVHDRLLKAINDGVMMVNYTGHGGHSGLADEKIFLNSDALGLRNKHLPIFVTAACGFSTYDNETVSAGENLLLNPTGGAIALFSTTRTVYSNENFEMNSLFLDEAFNENYTIGDIIRYAKSKSSSSNQSKMSFGLLGDPAMKLHYPPKAITTESLTENGVEVTTLSALAKITVNGYVEKSIGVVDEDFDGYVYPIIYDKELTYQTLGNDGEIPFTYNDQNNIIFNGKASVKNGQFSFTFVVPKDIRYNLGSGKIQYYAIDADSTKEVIGYYDAFEIGGSSSVENEDDEAPDVLMYMNNKEFKDGDFVSDSPTFYAEISDGSGINTIGTGIGHDMLIYLDDAALPIILNDFFEYNLDDYSSGIVSYKFTGLSEGLHTLTFRVWDLNNNSYTNTLSFRVQSNNASQNGPQITYYPNPTEGWLHISLNNDDNEEVEYHIRVYNLSGQMVYYEKQAHFSADGKVSMEVDLSGLTNGLYMIKIYYVANMVKNREKLYNFDTAKIYIHK